MRNSEMFDMVKYFQKMNPSSYKDVWAETYLLEDMFWKGRILSYRLDHHSVNTVIEPSMRDLIGVMDYFGKIRHDFNVYSFFPGRLYFAIFGISGSEIPASFSDFTLHHGSVSFDSHVANENYDNFVNPSNLVDRLRFLIQENLSSTQSMMVWARFAQDLPIEEIGRRFGISNSAARWELNQAIRQLRECGKLPEPKDICLYKVISEDLPVNALLD